MPRSAPYFFAEGESGGFPSWLLKYENLNVRISEETFMRYVGRYLSTLLSILAKYQFTNGGPIVAFQVENECGSSPTNDKVYLQQLYDIFKHYGIVELLVTADSPKRGTAGTLPGLLFQTANYESYPVELLGALEEMQPGEPLMAMEFYSGWFDHWSESHHTKSDGSVRRDYEATLTYPASVNLYMLHGGTYWGVLNGATIGPGDNSGLAPTTSSYDYNAPLTEDGDYTSKYDMIKGLIEQCNPIQTLTPELPVLIERQTHPAVPIKSQLSLNDILSKFDDSIPSSTTRSI
ncbi:hypothetical protein Zmor_000132 [Zophobas morio]|uniref:Glycoside hydrolase 35 catalytic domain-containing protein n=1 Tax=Zophobas morio TaxID=2755281 RepID=A0AA38J0A2_9CUCU|nr:hypothetical protein Zmor_000132 [Zophobas morio]